MSNNTRLAACILSDRPLSELEAAAAGGLDCAAGIPALALAASLLNVESVATLLRCGADVNAAYASEPFAGWRALHFAAAAPCGPDTDALLAILITAGADVTASTNDGFSATDIACTDHPETAQLLVAAGAPPPSAARHALHLQTQARATPRLHAVVDELEVSAVCEELLLGAYVDGADPAGRTPLHLAARLGCPPLVRLLAFSFGANVNVQDVLGRTPLLIAVSLDMPSTETVATLLALGADWNTPDALGATPMRVAVDRGRTQLVAMLAAAGAPVPAGVPASIAKQHRPVPEPINLMAQHAFAVSCISKGHLRALDMALATGKHSLHNLTVHAAAYGTVDSLQFFLSRGGDVSARLTHPAESLYSGASALHAACGTTEDRDDHVRLLLEAGADINATMPNGLKPLDVACRAATRSLLISRGAVRAERTADGASWKFTAQMMYAVANHDFEEAKQHLYAGVPVETRDVLGRTVMHSAASTGNCSLVISLLAHGAQPNAVSFDGRSALHYAVAGGHLGCCELLLAAGADAQQPSWLGVTPARLAALSGEWRILQLFTESVLPRQPAAAPPAQPPPPRARSRRAASVAAPPTPEAVARAEAAAAELLATEAAEAARAAAKVAKAAKRAAQAASRKAPPPRAAHSSSSEEEEEAEAPAPEASWPCLPRQKPVKRVRPRRRSYASAVAPPSAAAELKEPPPAPSAPSTESADDSFSSISEPDWLAELLEDRCDTAGERRTYVEQVVKDVGALRVEIDNAKLCIVCLSAEKSAVLLPCKHAGFCDGCAVALLRGPCPLCQTRVEECLLGLYCH
jgi:ankyrin repeat protein